MSPASASAEQNGISSMYASTSIPTQRHSRGDSGYSSLGSPSKRRGTHSSTSSNLYSSSYDSRLTESLASAGSPRKPSRTPGAAPEPAALSPAEEVVEQFRLISEGQLPSKTEFSISIDQYDEIEYRLDQEPDLRGFVYDKIRYDYFSEIKYLLIRMPTQQHQSVIKLLAKQIEKRLEDFRHSEEKHVSALAEHLEVSVLDTWKYEKKTDPDFEHPNVSDDSSSIPASSRALRQRSERSTAVGNGTNSFESSTSASSTGSTSSRTRTKYEPDISVYYNSPTGRVPTLAIEVMHTQTLPQLMEKLPRCLKDLGFLRIIGIDMASQSKEFDGNVLQKGAAYSFMWRTSWSRDEHDRALSLKPDLTLLRKIIAPKSTGSNREREVLEHLLLEDLTMFTLTPPDLIADTTDRETLEQLFTSLGKYEIDIPVADVLDAFCAGEEIEQAPLPLPIAERPLQSKRKHEVSFDFEKKVKEQVKRRRGHA